MTSQRKPRIEIRWPIVASVVLSIALAGSAFAVRANAIGEDGDSAFSLSLSLALVATIFLLLAIAPIRHAVLARESRMLLASLETGNDALVFGVFQLAALTSPFSSVKSDSPRAAIDDIDPRIAAIVVRDGEVAIWTSELSVPRNVGAVPFAAIQDVAIDRTAVGFRQIPTINLLVSDGRPRPTRLPLAPVVHARGGFRMLDSAEFEKLFEQFSVTIKHPQTQATGD
jgi:hypothetical protein